MAEPVRARRQRPARLRATYHRTRGIGYFHAATAWAMTSCGASLASIRAPITGWPR